MGKKPVINAFSQPGKTTRWSFLSVFLVILFFCPGCLLFRILTIKEQLCDFPAYFTVTTRKGLTLKTSAPVLFVEDIIRIAGMPPSETQVLKKRKKLVYRFHKKGEKTKKFDLPTEFEFVPVDGEYKLQQVHLDRNITDLVSADLIRDVLETLCHAEKSIPGRWLRVRVEKNILSRVPPLSGAMEILGTPASLVREETKKGKILILDYAYILEEEGEVEKEPQHSAKMKIRYNPSQKAYQTIHIHYMRYDISISFKNRWVVFSM